MKSLNSFWGNLLFVGAFFGGTACAPREFEVDVSSPEERLETAETVEEKVESEWEALTEDKGWEEEKLRPRFFSTGEAPPALSISVRDAHGRSRSIQPGKGDEILILVFWSLDSWLTSSAILHANYLLDLYGEYGVRGKGIAHNPDTYKNASRFLENHDVDLGNYYDDFSALKRLSRALEADIGTSLPCFFLFDREGRVRLYKIGFDPAGVADHQRGEELEVMENAPQGERIEDYLRQLISEDPPE